MINTLNVKTTVGHLVREMPGRSRIFENFGIDYCCGGKLSLAEACSNRGIDLEEILYALSNLENESPTGDKDPDSMGLAELADHIVATHHEYLRQELPRLNAMTQRVAEVHGKEEPRLLEIRRIFTAFMAEIILHMEKEENILFPIVRSLESGSGEQSIHCPSIADPIREMEEEHDNAGNAIEQFRYLTDGYQPPEWGCNTFRALYQALEQLELDMHQHVHKENNILFLKSLSLTGD